MNLNVGYQELSWLPAIADADVQIAALKGISDPERRLAQLRAISGHRLDPLQTQKVARLVARTFAELPVTAGLSPVRIAWLSSSTVQPLAGTLQVAGLRWGLRLDVHVGGYGQYRQEALDPASPLVGFQPDVVLFDLDPLATVPEIPLAASSSDVDAIVQARADAVESLWRAVQSRYQATVIQQSVPVMAEPLFGSFESRVPAAPASVTTAFNTVIKERAAAGGVTILDVEALASHGGKDLWFDPARWHHAKQLVAPAATLVYTEHIARLIAATRGLAKKCLVLDLDNTVWGGIVGDDGITGLLLGQGSAVGESFQSFQHYCRRLAERGVVLAICSKNDPAIAEAAFREHPEMALKHELIASFVANWDDKATNLRRIAGELNLGLDAFVFFDDNPVERSLVRRELPMVAVPEPPEDPAHYARCLRQAGYFEAVAFTAEDAARARQYRANAERELIRGSATDMDGYLKSLAMVLEVDRCDGLNLVRVAQLINKTNQFNLTTQRYTESDLRAFLAEPTTIAQCHRLKDTFGDNGIISVVLGRIDAQGRCLIDTWLMSCRVLGRGVEATVLNAFCADARSRGAAELVGKFRPTAKNGMVAGHYEKMGFVPVRNSDGGASETTYWSLPLDTFEPRRTHIQLTVKANHE
jgi:FkbH-like protein